MYMHHSHFSQEMTLTVEDMKREAKSYALDIVTRFSYINRGLSDLG